MSKRPFWTSSELVEMFLPVLYLLLSCHLLTLGKYLWFLWGVGLGFALGNGCFKLLHGLGIKVGGLPGRTGTAGGGSVGIVAGSGSKSMSCILS